MKRKIRVAILFGGRSAEHEISVLSARNIAEAIDKRKYRVTLIGINKSGEWYLCDALPVRRAGLAEVTGTGTRVILAPTRKGGCLVQLSDASSIGTIDVVFPVLHGPYGEDGTVQGLLKLANLPFVGAGILGSAIGMDKDVMKRLLRDAGIRTARFLVLDRSSPGGLNFEAIERSLGSPFFIKPANLGSSVGIHKVKDRKQFEAAMKDALRYDHKILIEEYVRGREIECSVLGNDRPIASLPGEIVPRHEFYSYEAKYLDEQGAVLEIPAKLPPHVIREVQEVSVRAFKVLCCEGMARVDFFVRDNEEVVVNEINTIPGFTKISMYPKMWEASGISYTELIDSLIQLALARFEREKRLKTSR